MKIEEIKKNELISDEEVTEQLATKLNLLIKAHNEREDITTMIIKPNENFEENIYKCKCGKLFTKGINCLTCSPLSHFFKPEKTETYYRINARLKIEEDANYESEDDKYNILVGNCYRTREEAQLALDKQQALVRLWDWADTNARFEPDWENKLSYHAVYDFLGRKLFSSGVTLKCGDILPYFKSSEDCDNFIKNNKEDLELILK